MSQSKELVVLDSGAVGDLFIPGETVVGTYTIVETSTRVRIRKKTGNMGTVYLRTRKSYVQPCSSIRRSTTTRSSWWVKANLTANT